MDKSEDLFLLGRDFPCRGRLQGELFLIKFSPLKFVNGGRRMTGNFCQQMIWSAVSRSKSIKRRCLIRGLAAIYHFFKTQIIRIGDFWIGWKPG